MPVQRLQYLKPGRRAMSKRNLQYLETRAQRWRALSKRKDGKEQLLILGSSYEQVKKTYPEPFFDLLDDEERGLVREIAIQKFIGSPDRGTWTDQSTLPIPKKDFTLPIKAKSEIDAMKA
jgi:hypothetical protein